MDDSIFNPEHARAGGRQFHVLIANHAGASGRRNDTKYTQQQGRGPDGLELYHTSARRIYNPIPNQATLPAHVQQALQAYYLNMR